MKIHELEITTKQNRKRLGRGIGSGTGKTSGRGTKGQNSRSGGGTRPGFEGGQNPLAKRLPKLRGFRAINPIDYTGLTLARLETLKGTTITNQTLVEQGILRSDKTPVKVLASGTLTKKFNVKLQATTAAAEAAIVKAGGSFTLEPVAKSPKKPSKRNRKG